MNELALPLEAHGVFVGFWLRLVAYLIDGVVLAPLGAASIWLAQQGATVAASVAIPVSILTTAYFVVFPALWGATPGKLAIGARITKVDGARIGWSEAWKREAVNIALGVVFVADRVWFVRTGHSSRYLSGLYYWLGPAWLLADTVALIINAHKRALHDRIAGTVVVRRRFAEQALPDGQH